MNILQESRSLLEAAGYRTLPEQKSSRVCYFEDDTLIGVVFVYDSFVELAEAWEVNQDRFLSSHSTRLRHDPRKAWNIYTVHLTPTLEGSDTNIDTFDIEQDFRGTRKIARTGIQSKAQLREAMLPLLPLQHRVIVSPTHLTERLSERLSRTSTSFERLLEDASVNDVVTELLEDK